jgi:hypothetical protein
MQVTVPINTHATVRLPAANNKILESGQPLAEVASVKILESAEQHCLVRIGSGDYDFRCEKY